MATLSLVYLLMGIHLAHWQLNGTTLAPLELNEVMHTLELGVVTAGFLFMCVATLSVLIFGRFFCSWGCHILALEDMAAWLLGKIGIKPKLVRSRALLIVPAAAMAYMFIWPQFRRLAGHFAPDLLPASLAMPEFEWRVLADGEGWASFITTDYARNLPGPGVTILTFIVVGFLMVWVLGTRAFCRLACPYGALFAAADKLTPGKILLRGNCTSCGHCTAACASSIRVHEETKAFGQVQDSACLKDLDCVAACPEQSLRFGFGTPALFQRAHADKPRRRYDLTLTEDFLAGGVFLGTLLSFRGLYGLIPFLLALAVGGIAAAAAVIVLRIFTRKEASLGKRTLRREGRITGTGRAALLAAGVMLLLTVHSGWLRWHTWRGETDLASLSVSGATPAREQATAAIDHFDLCARFGLAARETADHQCLAAAAAVGDAGLARPALKRMSRRTPEDARIWRALGEADATAGDMHSARRSFEEAVKQEPSFASWHDLGAFTLAQGDLAAALPALNNARQLNPDDAHTRELLTYAEQAIARSRR